MRLRLVSLIVITLALTLPATASAELTWSGPIALDHNGATSLIAVACATTTQCTAVDQIGQQVTFSPASGGGAAPSPTSPDGAPAAIACPSAHQCTEVNSSGGEVTFDPTAPGDPTPVVIESGHALFGIACPSTTRCVAVDDAGTGRVLEAARAAEAAGTRELLEEARSAYERAGAVHDQARAESALRALGSRRGVRGRRQRPRSGWEALTETELRVVRLAAERLTNPEIAERLFISRRTVQTHISLALTKLGVASRRELAAEAVRQAGWRIRVEGVGEQMEQAEPPHEGDPGRSSTLRTPEGGRSSSKEIATRTQPMIDRRGLRDIRQSGG